MSRTALVVVLAMTVGCAPKTVPPAPAAAPVSTAPTTTVEATPTDGTQTSSTEPAPVVEPAVNADERRRDKVNDAVALLTTDSTASVGTAVTKLEAVVAEDPSNAYAHFNLGVAHEKNGSELKARKAYLAAIAADESFGDAYVNLGGIDMRGGNAAAAENRYRQGLTQDPENMRLWTGLISSLRAQGRLEDAEQAAREALLIDTNSLDIYNNLGLVYIDRSQLDLANFIVNKAMTTISGGNTNANLHCTLGRIYQLQEKTGNAKMELERALELDGNLVPAMIYLSEYNLDNRNFGDTVTLLERARTLSPNDPSIHLNLGIAYRGVGRYEDAVTAYQTVSRLLPSSPDPHLNLGILYGDYVKNYEMAITEYETYKKMAGGDTTFVDDYIEKTLKEQKKVEKLKAKKAAAEAERKKREKAQEVIEKPPEPEPAPAVPAPEVPAPEVPAPEVPAPEVPAEAPPAEVPAEAPGSLDDIPMEIEGEEEPAEGAWGAVQVGTEAAEEAAEKVEEATESTEGGDATDSPWGN